MLLTDQTDAGSIAHRLSMDRRVDITSPLPSHLLLALNEQLSAVPGAMVRVHGDDVPSDLRFLECLTNAESLEVEVWDATSFQPIGALPHLRSLSVGRTKASSVSLSVLADLPLVEHLRIEGQRSGLEQIQRLTHLRTLRLQRCAGLKSFDLLANHPTLESIEILGSAVRDLAPLTTLNHLSRLWMREIRGLTALDLTPLGARPLGMLSLNHQPHVESLKEMGDADIVHLSLDGLKNLQTLCDLATWPVLTMLGLRDCKPADGNIRCLADNPRIQHIALAFVVPEAERQKLLQAFNGRSLNYRSEMLAGRESPDGIIAGRLDL